MSTIPWLLPDSLEFPSTYSALDDPNGLLAVGGDLSAERLIYAYSLGIFPWYEEPQPILWWSPSPRAVLFPSNIHIAKSLRKTLKKRVFQVTTDQAFKDVMQQCAQVPRQGQSGTWIGPDMLNAYQSLHHRGIAHSLEVWTNGQLVGGLYGISLGKVFFGESMFSLERDASKIALVYLATNLSQSGYAMIDCQVGNPHLFSMGAEEINRLEFNRILLSNIRDQDLKSSNQHWPALLDHPII